jgi:hypothetical protein
VTKLKEERFMPAEFINILNLPELDIGHSKKVLFPSFRSTPAKTGGEPESRKHKETGLPLSR